jgi:hypothetical protein
MASVWFGEHHRILVALEEDHRLRHALGME